VPSSKQVLDQEREEGDTYVSERSPSNRLDRVQAYWILLLKYGLGSTNPSAEAKQLFCLLLEISILGVIKQEDNWSWGIPAGCWEDHFESDGSLKTCMILYWFRRCSE
jgi:hypothetical protein